MLLGGKFFCWFRWQALFIGFKWQSKSTDLDQATNKSLKRFIVCVADCEFFFLFFFRFDVLF